MKRSAFTFWEVVVLLSVFTILAIIFWPTRCSSRLNAQRSSCQSNLKQVGLALHQYIRDYDAAYPLANARKKGWMDGIAPYMKNTQLFQCPSEAKGRLDGTTDYFYNARMSGLNMDKIRYDSSIIMLGDGLSDAPTNASFDKLPLGWKNNKNSPAWRHLDGANYGFADGHVKWLKPERVTGAKPRDSVYTFAVR